MSVESREQLAFIYPTDRGNRQLQFTYTLDLLRKPELADSTILGNRFALE